MILISEVFRELLPLRYTWVHVCECLYCISCSCARCSSLAMQWTVLHIKTNFHLHANVRNARNAKHFRVSVRVIATNPKKSPFFIAMSVHGAPVCLTTQRTQPIESIHFHARNAWSANSSTRQSYPVRNTQTSFRLSSCHSLRYVPCERCIRVYVCYVRRVELETRPKSCTRHRQWVCIEGRRCHLLSYGRWPQHSW